MKRWVFLIRREENEFIVSKISLYVLTLLCFPLASIWAATDLNNDQTVGQINTRAVDWVNQYPNQTVQLNQVPQASSLQIHNRENIYGSNIYTQQGGGWGATHAYYPEQERDNTFYFIIILIVVIILSVFFLLINKSTALKLRMQGQILSLSVVLLIIFLILGGTTYTYLLKINSELKAIAEEDIPISNSVTNIEILQTRQILLLNKITNKTNRTNRNLRSTTEGIEKLKAKFEENSNTINAEFNNAFYICEYVIRDEKSNFILNEFIMVKNVLIGLVNQNKEFNVRAKALISAIENRRFSEVKQLYSEIETEEEELSKSTEQLLLELTRFTQKSALIAEKHEKNALRITLFLLIIGLILGFSFSLYYARKVSGTLKAMVNETQKFTNGNLSINLNLQRNDEIGAMGIALTNMATKIKNIVREISSGANNISASGDQLSGMSQQISQGANEQASSIEEVSSTMEQISSNIQQNAENAKNTENKSVRAESEITGLKKQFQRVVEASEEISEKIEVINDITFQTNLLALNAAIEAAKAGEHGKGFAVVAAEVKNLANKSKIAADEIIKLAVNSYNLSEEVNNSINETLPEISKTTLLVQEISAASHEQNNGAIQVSSAIQQLNAVSQQNASASEELASGAEELASQAEELKSLISFFKIEKNNNDYHKNETEQKQPDLGAFQFINNSEADDEFVKF